MFHGQATPQMQDAPDRRARMIARLSHDYLSASPEERQSIADRIDALIADGPLRMIDGGAGQR